MVVEDAASLPSLTRLKLSVIEDEFRQIPTVGVTLLCKLNDSGMLYSSVLPAACNELKSHRSQV